MDCQHQLTDYAYLLSFQIAPLSPRNAAFLLVTMAMFFKPHARGVPPLLSAVLNSDLEAMATIIASGANVNMMFGGSKETALHMASKIGNVDTIKLLLSKGADINMISFNRNTPLYIACYYSREDAAKFLIEQECDVNQEDVTHRSPLMLAIERGLTSLIQILLDHPDCDVSHYDRRRRNILHHAVLGRNIDAIKILQTKKLVKYLSDRPDRLGVFPILMPARKGYLNVMTALLSAGADPNVHDSRFPNCQTALQEAILNGHLHIVQLLLAYGADLQCDPNAQPNAPRAVSPVSLSLMTNHERTDILQALLEEGASVNIKFGGQDYTPLHLAVDQGFFLMAKMIVLAKCDLAANKNWIEDYMQRENNSAEKEEFFRWLEGFLEEANRPSRLSYWCRDVIRETVDYKRPISDQINKLPVPPKLINFLLFRDVQ